MWRSRERTKALARFDRELDRIREQLDRDVAFVYEATVFEDATAVWAEPRAATPTEPAPTPAMIAAALNGLKIAHLVVEDCWYSCPKARDADGDSECCNDAISDGACNCGADAHNAKVEALRSSLPAPEQ